MEKIINGKRYDTDRCEELCQWERGGEFVTDLDYGYKALVVAPDGNYLIYYHASIRGRSYGYRHQLKPVTVAAAKELLAEYGSADKYEEIFGKVERV